MPADICRFADFELDHGAYQLRRKGRPVQLERIPLDLLFLLAERPAQLVTRQEILARIWGKQVFIETDNSINTAIGKIRQALHDDADAPRFVVTVPTKGYRFIAPLRDVHSATSRREDRRETVAEQSTSMVGRGRELAELRAALADANAGRGRLFLLSGEPGIGKSRLATELASLAHVSGMAAGIGHCVDREEAVPYLPFVEILESYADRASDPKTLRKLLGTEGAELARMAPKLRRSLPDLAPPLDLEAQQSRRHLFNCFCDFIARMAAEQPALFILEDLHWAGDSTLSLLDHLVKRLARLPLLIVATLREAELDVSPALAQTLEDLLRERMASRVRLRRLASDDVAAMLTRLSGKSPPAKVVSEIYAETGGNPFFVEELFLHLEEENRVYDSDGNFRAELNIGEFDAPGSVRLVVGRRLARLGDPTRKTLASAATIGRSFSFEILKAAVAADADSLLEAVAEAEGAGLIVSHAEDIGARFEFSHELIRQAILSSLSAALRERLHLQVAEAIERTFGDALEDHVAELAHHYRRTTNTLKAVEYLTRSAQWAFAHSAYQEADAPIAMALALLERLTNSEHLERELRLRLLATETAKVLEGYASAKVVDAATRALQLARRLGDRQAEFAANSALFWHFLAVGNFNRQREMAEALVAQADDFDDSAFRIVAHHMLGINRAGSGDFASARTHFEIAIEAYHSAPDHRDYEMRNSFTHCHGLLGELLCQSGFLDQGLAMARRGVELAREFNRAHMLAWQLESLALVHRMRGEIADTLAAADELAALVEIYGLSQHPPGVRGWAMARKGQLTGNVELTNQGVELLTIAGARFLLAEVALRAGDSTAGLAALDAPKPKGIARGEEEGLFTFYFSLLKALLLELNAGETKTSEAEKLLRYFLEWVRERPAKLEELAATRGLARIMARTGRRDEAREMLAEIYHWFTEGLDTAPLRDAKALLDELTG